MAPRTKCYFHIPISSQSYKRGIMKPPKHPTHIDGETYDPWPILQPQILFEQLVLFPIAKASENNTANKGFNATIHERLRKLKQGKIRELYKESRQVKSKTPKQKAIPPVNVQRAAQVAADLEPVKHSSEKNRWQLGHC